MEAARERAGRRLVKKNRMVVFNYLFFQREVDGSAATARTNGRAPFGARSRPARGPLGALQPSCASFFCCRASFRRRPRASASGGGTAFPICRWRWCSR